MSFLRKVEAAGFKHNTHQLKNPFHGREGIAIYTIPPEEFLKLTTSSEAEMQRILQSDRVQPVDVYNQSPANTIFPFLYLDDTGKVKGHEGRHRSAALIKEGWKEFEIALIATKTHDWPEAKYGEEYKRTLPFPTELISQYGAYTHKVDPSKIEPATKYKKQQPRWA